ncbi:MAG: hypothetical protein ABJP45_07450 [Cyclobacteriaceae bacterium]
MRLLDNIERYALVFTAGEAIATVLFYFVARGFSKKLTLAIVIRGWLERAFLFVALLKNLPQALILFGALKIGTRLKDGENKISNDYFLVGNLISALIVLVYYIISTEVFNT